MRTRAQDRAARVHPLLWLALVAALLFLVFAVFNAGRGDGPAVYYGVRCFVAGRNGYDQDTIVAEWRRDHAPPIARPGLPNAVFLNPPSLVLLLAPCALLPWHAGLAALRWLAALAALATALILCRLSGRAWGPAQWVGFTALALLMSPTGYVVRMAQTGLFAIAALAGFLYAFRRGRNVLAGLLLAVSFVKFTLTLPFLGVLIYRRHWSTALTAVLATVVLNVIVLAPVGVRTGVRSYAQAYAATAIPGGAQDAAGSDWSDNATSMIHAERLFFAILGPNRPLVRAVNACFWAACVLAGLWAFRRTRDGRRAFEDPLEIILAVMLGLALFYHRFQDLAMMIVAFWALLERWREANGARQRSELLLAVLLLLLAFGMKGSLGLSSVVEKLFGLVHIPYPKPVLVMAALLVAFYVAIREKGRPAPPADEPAEALVLDRMLEAARHA